MRELTQPTQERVYRVVVERLTPSGDTVYQTEYFGPYNTPGAAKGQATSHYFRENRNGRKGRAYVEFVPAIDWERLY